MARLSVVVFVGLFYAFGAAVKYRSPVLDLPDPQATFVGVVQEDQTTVDVVPEIKIKLDTGPVCAYVLRYADEDASSKDLPFVVKVDRQDTGVASIRVKDGAKLDCESRKEYKLLLSARRCTSDSIDDDVDESEAQITIKVEDVNEFAPEFEKSWYEVTMDEGRLYDHIAQLKATDRDCSRRYSEICRYEITNNAAPFVIDTSGILRNTAPLNWAESKSHVLTVVAHDCGMKQSRQVLVTVNVRQSCVNSWKGIPERVDYSVLSGARPLFSNASLEICDSSCIVQQITSVIHMNTEHIARGCDREWASVKSQLTMCNAAPETISLLPDNKELKSEHVEQDSLLRSDQMASDTETDEVYMFDGEQNAVVIPAERLKPVLPAQFTIGFWMKHAGARSKSEQHTRENIICSSDDHAMNRHHFAVYVRNCKLEVLLRREFTDASQKDQPSEWRWPLSETCDGRWHHYALSVKFPEVQVYVDGKLLPSDAAEMLTDWPMHATKDIKTRLVVGACWHGRNDRMVQFFKGYLFGMTFLPGKLERAGVVECMQACKESLNFDDGLAALKPGDEAVFAHDASELRLISTSKDGMVDMMRMVSYENRVKKPTLGYRPLFVETSFKCSGTEKAVEVSAKKIYLFVNEQSIAAANSTEHQTSVQTVKLTTSTEILTSKEDVGRGVNLFPGLDISVENDKVQLKSCQISIDPALDKDNEYFSSPAALIANLGLDFQHTNNGLMLQGSDGITAYRDVLRQVHYFNLRADQINERTFVLQCTANNNGASNVVTVKLSTVKPQALKALATAVSEEATGKQQSEKEKPLKAATLEHHVEHRPVLPPSALRMQDRLEADIERLPFESPAGNLNVHPSAGAGTLVAVVVVVCVCLVLLVVVIGIVRMRKSHTSRRRPRNGSTAGGNELAWDDAGTGLIHVQVNPMEQMATAESGVQGRMDDNESTDCDDDSYRDEDDGFSDEDSDQDEVLPHLDSGRKGSTGLEWEDDAATFQAPPRGRTAVHNTYRV